MAHRKSNPNAAPALSTKRLRLRSHLLQDFDMLAAIWTEPAVYAHILGKPSTPEESWNRLLRYCGHWNLLGFGYWVVEEKETGKYVGEMSYADYHRDMIPSLEGRPELGWALMTVAQGKGYATEALTEIVKWGDANFGARETACMISPKNAASLNVAGKIGFLESLRATYHGNEAVVLFRTPPL
jgi:RimJ/RimL family protein N-acetyltransferase